MKGMRHMAQAKQGDKVKIDYTGTLEDGTVFDSTLESECDSDECGCEEDGDCGDDDCGCGCESGPMTLTIGEGELFPQVDEALVGMAPGEKKTLRFALGKDELTYWSPSEKKWVLEPAVYDVWAGEDSTAKLHASFELTQ